MAIKIPNPAALAAFQSCKSRVDVANVLGTSLKRLEYHLFSPKSLPYVDIRIPKSNGGHRRISIPPPYIRLWQRELLTFLTALYKPKVSAHGFIPDRSIKSNAANHVGRRLVLNIDLEDFFPSIHFGRTRGVFHKSPFNFTHDVATLLAQICTNAGHLPQGAPTSPMLSNFVCRRMDNELRLFALRQGCIYTRFADDISFSTNKSAFPAAVVKVASILTDATELGDKLLDIIASQDFLVNHKKTRIRGRMNRQEVTGLVINTKVNVPRNYTKRLRAILFDWKMNGVTAAEKKFQSFDLKRKTRKGASPKLFDHVTGKLDFLRMIRGDGDMIYTKHALIARKLDKRSKIVSILGESSRVISFLSESMWIVIGRDAYGDDVAQGSALYLRDVGFVTASHVIFEPAVPVQDWVLIRGIAPHNEHKVTSCKHHGHLDIAILHTDAAPTGTFVRSDSGIQNGDAVAVVGYPNWHSLGDELLRAGAFIVHKKTVSGVKLFSVSYSLLTGNSGGPALNQAGEVIGVVVKSKDDATVPNGVVEISHIDDVAAQPTVRL